MEINNARYDGEIKQFAEELSQDSFFEKHRVFSATYMKRMRDVSFTLSLVITVMSTYFNSENEFDRYLRQYNDEFEEGPTLKIEFHKVFQFINKCRIPEKSCAWKKTDLFILLVEIYRALFIKENNIRPLEVEKRQLRFYDLVNTLTKANEEDETEHNKIQEYYKAAIQGTQSRLNRIRRGKIIKDVINGDFVFDTKK